MKTIKHQVRILVLAAAAVITLPATAGGLGGALGGGVGGSLGGSLGGSFDMSRSQGGPVTSSESGESGFGRGALGGVHEGLGRGSRVARESAAEARERADGGAQRTRAAAERAEAAARRDRELQLDADAPTHVKASRSEGVQGATAPTGAGRLAPVAAPAASSESAAPAAASDASTAK